jgi:CheY-like chemotaxis protein
MDADISSTHSPQSAVCTVLIVEDHADTLETLEELVEADGHAHFGATDGREALHWLSEQKVLPCIIILDLRMPVMDGWDFLETLRTHPGWSDIPVIVVSASIKANRPKPLLRAQAYWPKPPEAHQFTNLHRYCETHRSA